MSSFKELLLLKAAFHREELRSYIESLSKHDIDFYVLESLEKADSKKKGKLAGPAIVHMAKTFDPDLDPHMIHDALSHHASHYKAAIDGGDKNKANKHAAKIFGIMNLAKKLETHIPGNEDRSKLSVEAVHPKAWEYNHSSFQINPEHGKVTNDTKGWAFNMKDFGFLQNPPPTHAQAAREVKGHGYTGGYPLEQIKINGQHIDIREPSASAEHIFDSHPIFSPGMADMKLSPEKAKLFEQKLHEYTAHPDVAAWADSHFEPTTHAARQERTAKPAEPVHKVAPVDIANYSGSQAPTMSSDDIDAKLAHIMSLGVPAKPKPKSESAGNVDDQIGAILGGKK